MSLLSLFILFTSLVNGHITVYHAQPTSSTTSSLPQLTPPPIPTPPIINNFQLDLQSQNYSRLSKQQSGNFLGFSIEIAVANQISMSYLFTIHHANIS
jgi:hypothetical protein